jgi:hypothetical protein
MSIQIVDNFQINVAKPVDSRIVASGSVARDNIPYKYEGLRVFDTSNGVSYVWYGGTWSGENASSITGNGSTNYLPRYNTSNTLASSVIFQSSNNIGIGTTTFGTPTAKLQVAGIVRTTTGGFYGDGNNITNLNASQILTGSMNVSRLQVTGSSGYMLIRNASSAYWEDPALIKVGALKTPRTLWGRSFDGSANVTGNLSDVGTIAMGTNGAFRATIQYTIGKNVILNIPDVGTTTKTFAFLEQAQTFTGAQTISSSLTVGSTASFLSTFQISTSLTTRFKVSGSTITFGPDALGSPYIRTGNNTTSTVPSFTWWGNDQLGIYRPANDVMGFVSAGVEKMRINTTGVSIGTSGNSLARVTAGTVQIKQDGTAPTIVRGSGFTAVANTSGNTPVITVTLTGTVGSDMLVVASMDGSVNYYKFRCAAEKVNSSSFKLVVAYEDGTGGAWPDTWTGSVNVSFICVCI